MTLFISDPLSALRYDIRIKARVGYDMKKVML